MAVIWNKGVEWFRYIYAVRRAVERVAFLRTKRRAQCHKVTLTNYVY